MIGGGKVDLDIFKVKILSGYHMPCHDVDPFGQCSIEDCMTCFNAKVTYERVKEECKEDVSIFDNGTKEWAYRSTNKK